MKKPVLIIGSGPNAVQAVSWDKSIFSALVCINNAWQVRPDWDYLVYPDDFPAARLPQTPQADQFLIDENDFVPTQNEFGGFVYAGGTMAYTTAYWVLARLKPEVMLFIGCDMHYPKTGPTHFYGTGSPDPLRDDITLTSLEASSARLYCLAHTAGCQIYNLSDSPSRLLFDRATIVKDSQLVLASSYPAPSKMKMQTALMQEDRLGYLVENGRYWESDIAFDRAALCALDIAWLESSPFSFRPEHRS